MEEILGHNVILDFFEKVKANNKMSHAYCFVGPKNVGKMTVAKYLGAQILGVKPEKIFTSPDFFLLEQIIKEKTGKLGKDISIDQVRELVNFVSKRSFLGGYKIVIIDNAHLLSTSASNAILKTLEEPSEKTVIFLITDDDKKILPTILSRCQTINFSTVSDEILRIFLKKNNLSTEDIDFIQKYSCGLPGIAVKLMSDSEYLIMYKNEIERFRNLFGKLFFEKLKLVEELFGDKKDHIQARNNLVDVLDIWQTCLHLDIQEKENLDKATFLNIYNSIENAKVLLGKNVHPRLLIENILLQII
ncbi:MAG: AAA family ATPase [Candidatus Magasanikbacteria bacterium]